LIGQIHHIGYVVKDIETYAASFPLAVLENTIFDPLQNAKLAVYSVGASARLEFIQPSDPNSFTWRFLQRSGAGLHHICYEGLRLDDVNKVIRECKMLKLRGPMPAVLFGRDVVFAMTRQKAIVEFLL
jgi:hypothetical protein